MKQICLQARGTVELCPSNTFFFSIRTYIVCGKSYRCFAGAKVDLTTAASMYVGN